MPDTAPSAPKLHATALLEAIRAIVGDRDLLTDSSDTAAYVEDWRRLYKGRTSAVIRPGTTQELAAVVQLCAQAGAAIVPQAATPPWSVVPSRPQTDRNLSSAPLGLTASATLIRST